MGFLSELFPHQSSNVSSKLNFVNGSLQLSIPASKLLPISDFEREQLLLPVFKRKYEAQGPTQENATGEVGEFEEVVAIQDVEVVSVIENKKKRGAPRLPMSEKLSKRIEGNSKYPKMNTTCQTSYRYYWRAKEENPSRYKKMLLEGRMRSQIKSWRDREATLLKEKRSLEKDLKDLKNKKAKKSEIRSVENKILTRKRKLDYRAPILQLYNDDGAQAAMCKKRKMDEEKPSLQNMATHEDISESDILLMKKNLEIKERQYDVALAMMAEQAKNQARLEAKIQHKDEMLSEFARVLIQTNESLYSLKKELKQSQTQNREYVDAISSLRKENFDLIISNGLEQKRLDNENAIVVQEMNKQNALLLEHKQHIDQLESRQDEGALRQRQIFDMETAYKAQKDILQSTIEELEKELEQEREQFKLLQRLYCTVTGRCTSNSTFPDEDEDAHANFDDGLGDHAFDEWKNTPEYLPEQDRKVVYDVIKAAKDGNLDDFKKHFDTEFVVPDDYTEAKLTEKEETFLDNNGVQGIAYLAFDFASTQPFGNKICADADSFKKAIQRCLEHEEFARRVSLIPVEKNEPSPENNQQQTTVQVQDVDDQEYEDIVVDPNDPLEANLLLLEPQKETRLAKLQDIPKCEMTEDDDFHLNELMAEKIANTRCVRFKESRMEKQKKVCWEADNLMSRDVLEVPLTNKLSDGQLKLILRTHTREDDIQLQHPFGLVTSSKTDIDAYYKRYNIDEKKYPKDKC